MSISQVVSCMSLVGLMAAAPGAAWAQGGTTPRGATPRVALTAADVNATDVYGTTPLHKAADANDLAAVQRLLAAGANPNALTRYHVAPMSIAILRGNAGIVAALIEAGADPNTLTGEGEPVLLTAARSGNLDIVKALVAAHADVNIRERFYGQTAIMWAAIANHADVIAELADHGGDVNARANVLEGDPTWRYGKDSRNGINGEALQNFNTNFSKGGLTALMYAAREGSVDAIRTLIEKGADKGSVDPEGFSPLHLAIMNAHFDAAATLIDGGADVNQMARGGQSPLFALVDMRSLLWTYNRPTPRAENDMDTMELAKVMIARGAKVDAPLTGRIGRPLGGGGAPIAGKGATAFLRASVVSDLPMMRLLLEHGANPKVTTENGDNALLAVAGHRWDDNTMRPAVTLGFATEDDSVEAVKMLLDLGLDVNAADKQGFTAVHGASERGANRVLQLLVDNGARLDVMSEANVRDTNVDNEPPVKIPGQSPIDAALAANPPREETAALLRELMTKQGVPVPPVNLPERTR
jgi:ankyrin repeat protein